MREERRFGAYDAAVVAAQALPFAVFAGRRFVDGDEGTYAMAAKLVADGRLPYLDFVYGQTPALALVYGGWVAALGESWYSLRALTWLFAAAIGALLYLHVRAMAGRGLATAAAAVYATNGIALAWLTPVKTYALATLFVFAAYAVVVRAPSDRWPRWLVGGVLAGLAVDTRLMLAAALPAFAWHLWSARATARSAAAAVGGVALGLLPLLAFAAADPERTAFDTFGTYANREEGGLAGDLVQKGRTVANLAGVGTPDGALPQFLLLALACAAAAAVLLVLRRGVSLALLAGVLLVAAALVPTPTYAQYLVPAIPFLIVAAFEGVAALRDALPAGDVRRALTAVGGVVLALYAALALDDARRYLTQHEGERLGPVREVARIVDERTEPGDEVIVSWPGYLFETEAVPAPGLETDFGPSSAARIDPEDARTHGRVSAAEVERRLREGGSPVVVVKRWHHLPPLPRWEQALEAGGYEVVARVPGGSNLEPTGEVLVYSRGAG